MDVDISGGTRSLSIALAVASVTAIFLYRHFRRSVLPDPPGPDGIPIFGNEFQIPRDKQWLRFHQWGLEYGETGEIMVVDDKPTDFCLEGDVVRITTMGQPVIILSSAKAAFELLDARGSIQLSSITLK